MKKSLINLNVAGHMMNMSLSRKNSILPIMVPKKHIMLMLCWGMMYGVTTGYKGCYRYKSHSEKIGGLFFIESKYPGTIYGGIKHEFNLDSLVAKFKTWNDIQVFSLLDFKYSPPTIYYSRSIGAVKIYMYKNNKTWVWNLKEYHLN